MRWMISLFVLGTLLMPSANSLAGTQRLDRPDPIIVHGESDLGWHFYNEYAEEVNDEDAPELTTQPEAPTAPAPPTPPDVFSTAWFAANYERIEKAAIDHPSKENLRALLVTERMMLDKSEVFARNKVRVAATDPLLQDNMRIPLSGYSKSLMFKYKKNNIKLALETLSTKAGIFYFYDGKCIFCHQMLQTLNYLREIHGWEIRVIAKNILTPHIQDLDPAIRVVRDVHHSKNFHIKYWPTLMMVVPESDTPHYIITQGVMSLNTLVQTILTIALEHQALDDEWFYKVFPEEQGLVSPTQLATIPKDISDNPSKLINHAMEAIAHPSGTKAYLIDLEDEDHEH